MHEVISNAQKGFTPYDGVIEHNFLVDQHLAAARRDKVDKFAAWLDISNAFGSIPHAVIFQELRACGVDREFIGLVNNIYQNATASVITNEGPTPSIPLRSGVKQGCPLSGILFNIAINRGHANTHTRRRGLVYVSREARGFLSSKEFWNGKRSSLPCRENLNIPPCPLAKNRRIQELLFSIPQLFNAYSPARQNGLEEVYIRQGKKFGGCPSIPAVDSDFYLIDTAFKLLTSKDEDVTIQAMGQLKRTVSHRIGRPPTDGDLASFLSGSMEGKYKTSSNRHTNVWTNARKASDRQCVTWSFSQGQPSISFGDETLTASHRRKILRSFHDNKQTTAAYKLLEMNSQGINATTTSWQELKQPLRSRAKSCLRTRWLTTTYVLDLRRAERDVSNSQIIDVTIPFENRRNAFAEARRRKLEKYKSTVDFFKTAHNQICTAKFQNLRTYYRNEKKKLSSFTSGTGARDFAPKWEHFTRLQFLDDTIEPLDSTSNLDY
ncbi:retrovirus-related Pol polyprotein from type-1 retrotransposable element R2 [Trichonephila inaurata madagascariensis]|uniref:Retrovirus-related Pol polyprotein from type-1 retrotransposable element R2 n=1 Tax=Trichonephila inaurata madagascariensis TaxID=2747483 RepID=A0A8X6YG09_9ARAC|nr:retrovirus-related Pol polyprotein from type-1 retrotransposable element R2 [Trichonephila inaurata madagascariensis]